MQPSDSMQTAARSLSLESSAYTGRIEGQGAGQGHMLQTQDSRTLPKYIIFHPSPSPSSITLSISFLFLQPRMTQLCFSFIHGQNIP